jgi:NDP-sugar pyrophosphorylase family protein
MTAPLPAPPQAVILAGGRGSRLGPLTDRTPKVLLPVGGRPFLAMPLAHLRSQGVTRVHLCLGFGAEQVVRFLDGRPADGIDVTTSVELTPQGTAGCLRLAASHLDDEFMVLVGDSYLPVDLRRLAAAYREHGTEAAMVVLRNRDRLVPSNVRAQDGLVTRYDKGLPPGTFEHVDYGIAFLRRTALARIPEIGPADLSTLFRSLVAHRQLAALEVSQRFYEIGSVAGYAELCDHLLEKRLSAVGGAAP